VVHEAAQTAQRIPSASGSAGYARRRPEATTLYRVVKDNLLTLYAATEAGEAAAPLPAFVREELEGYLGCGLLCRGFARLRCDDCAEDRLVAFSCKGRGFCPSCLGRRMAATAANLLDHVLPPGAPLRQWVLTLPYPLRARLAYDGPLLAAVCRLFVDTVLAWYRRRMAVEGVRDGQSGAVTVIQRTSSDLRCNPHLHVLVLDGVFAPDAVGTPRFHGLPHLSTTAVADVLALARARIVRFLRRRGVVEVDDEAILVTDEFAQREPELARLAATAVSGTGPAGPARRKPLLVSLPGRPGTEVTSPLSVSDLGFSLHARTRAGGDDTRAREALVKYVLRPPLASEHVQLAPDGTVRLRLKKPFRDGTVAVLLDGLALLTRLCAAVPPPRLHTIRYGGVLAPGARFRPLVVPPPPTASSSAATPSENAPSPEPPHTPPPADAAAPGHPETHRCRYRPWAELMKRTFAVDVIACPRCAGRMRLLALVKDKDSVSRFLAGIGEPTLPPPLAPARAPPYVTGARLPGALPPHPGFFDDPS
jgi:hypothetical protein